MVADRSPWEGHLLDESSPPPAPRLDYERKRKPWSLADVWRQYRWTILTFLPVFLWLGYQDLSRRYYQKAEREFNARVAPLLAGDPRFTWVFVGGESGFIRRRISPSGVVECPADREALRVILQGAKPPMPLDLQFITARYSNEAATQAAAAATQAAADQQRLVAQLDAEAKRWQEKWDADRAREKAMQSAEREFNSRVNPLLKREPRFRGILVHGELGYLSKSIQPFGYLWTEKDREDLRKILQDAHPPMPLDFTYVWVEPKRFTSTRRTTGPTTE